MYGFPTVQTNLFALFLLSIVLFNIRGRSSRMLIEQRMFFFLTASIAVCLATDTAMWALDGRTAAWVRPALFVATDLYFIFNCVAPVLWMIYADFLLTRSAKRHWRILPFALAPLAVMIVLILINFGDRQHFYMITAANHYMRGPQLIWILVFAYICLVVPMLYMFRLRKAVDRRLAGPIVTFALMPLAAGVVQWLYMGTTLIWPATALALTLVFINLQNRQIYTDHLTGLQNRWQLDRYIYQRVSSLANGRMIGGLMIDINCFKTINDTYGHQTGDRALAATARILMNTFRSQDYVGRYGGDEFLVLLEIRDREDLPNMVLRLSDAVDQFNRERSEPFELSLSIGFGYLDGRSREAIAEFLSRIDRMMYEKKAEFGRRRVSSYS